MVLAETKNGKSRVVYLNPLSLAEIEKLKAEERLMRTRNTRATEAGGYTANGFDFADSDRGVGVFDIVRWLIRTF